MRSVFLILLLANLILFAAQFSSVQDLVLGARSPAVPAQINSEKLRIIRDTSVTPRAPAPPISPAS